MSNDVARILGILEVEEREAIFFQDSQGNGYVNFINDNQKVTLALESVELKYHIINEFDDEFGDAPSDASIKKAIRILNARSYRQGNIFEPDFRVRSIVSSVRNCIEYDFGRPDRLVCIITAEGWELGASQGYFIKQQSMLEQGLPVALAADETPSMVLQEFKTLCNLNDEQFLLMMVFILACFRPGAPFPIGILQGEQGSRKSTISMFIKGVVDPNLAPINTLPKTEQDFMIAMKSNRVLVYDNISGLTQEKSDWICRGATGGGLTVRKLYTTGEQMTFTGACSIILNGIDEIAQRSDLLSRSVKLMLDPIESGSRLNFDAVNQQFQDLKPRLLAAIFDMLSEILRKLPETVIDTDLRMIDIVRWATAAEGLMGVESGAILEACERNYSQSTSESLDDNVVGSVLLEYMSTRSEWNGTSTDLLDRLTRSAGNWATRSKDWPKQPNKLSKALNRLITSFRSEGIDIESSREGGTGIRNWTITNHNISSASDNSEPEQQEDAAA